MREGAIGTFATVECCVAHGLEVEGGQHEVRREQLLWTRERHAERIGPTQAQLQGVPVNAEPFGGDRRGRSRGRRPPA